MLCFIALLVGGIVQSCGLKHGVDPTITDTTDVMMDSGFAKAHTDEILDLAEKIMFLKLKTAIVILVGSHHEDDIESLLVSEQNLAEGFLEHHVTMVVQDEPKSISILHGKHFVTQELSIKRPIKKYVSAQSITWAKAEGDAIEAKLKLGFLPTLEPPICRMKSAVCYLPQTSEGVSDLTSGAGLQPMETWVNEQMKQHEGTQDYESFMKHREDRKKIKVLTPEEKHKQHWLKEIKGGCESRNRQQMYDLLDQLKLKHEETLASLLEWCNSPFDKGLVPKGCIDDECYFAQDWEKGNS